MALTADEFHRDLEDAAHRAARRQTVVTLVQTLVLVVLVLWAVVTTTTVARDLRAARDVQRVTAEQNRIQTEVLCALAADRADALAGARVPAGCADYLER